MTADMPDPVEVAREALAAHIEERGSPFYTARAHDIRAGSADDCLAMRDAILGARAMQDAMQDAMAGVRKDYAAICTELGCIEKPGVALRFIQEMRKNLTAAGERIDWLLRSWDDATITERQELDRMRRGWGPTTPTERMLRHRDLRDCMQVLSGALTDLATPEDDNADPEVEARLQEAYDRVNKRYLASLEILRRLDEPLERPDLEPSGAQEGAEDQQTSGAGLEDDPSPVEAMAIACGMLPPDVNRHDAITKKWLSDPAIKSAVHGATPASDATGLIARLRETSPRYDRLTGEHMYNVCENRDGEEAAAALEALQAEVARLTPDGDKPTYDGLSADFRRANELWGETARIEREQRARATAAESERDALKAEVEKLHIALGGAG